MIPAEPGQPSQPTPTIPKPSPQPTPQPSPTPVTPPVAPKTTAPPIAPTPVSQFNPTKWLGDAYGAASAYVSNIVNPIINTISGPNGSTFLNTIVNNTPLPYRTGAAYTAGAAEALIYRPAEASRISQASQDLTRRQQQQNLDVSDFTMKAMAYQQRINDLKTNQPGLNLGTNPEIISQFNDLNTEYNNLQVRQANLDSENKALQQRIDLYSNPFGTSGVHTGNTTIDKIAGLAGQGLQKVQEDFFQKGREGWEKWGTGAASFVDRAITNEKSFQEKYLPSMTNTSGVAFGLSAQRSILNGLIETPAMLAGTGEQAIAATRTGGNLLLTNPAVLPYAIGMAGGTFIGGNITAALQDPIKYGTQLIALGLIDDVGMRAAGRIPGAGIAKSEISGYLNSRDLAPEQRIMYMNAIRAERNIRGIEPGRMDAPDLTTASAVNPHAHIVEDVLREEPHGIYGGATMESQFVKRTPRPTHDVDVNVIDPESTAKKIVGKIDQPGISIDTEKSGLVTRGPTGHMVDSHEAPEGYPLSQGVTGKGKIEVDEELSNKGMGTKLFGDPISEMPSRSQVYEKNGLQQERLDMSASRKFSATNKDILNPMEKGYRFEKDFYDAQNIGRELIDVQRERLTKANPLTSVVGNLKLDMAERSLDKMLEGRLTYKTRSGEIKTRTGQEIYNEFENAKKAKPSLDNELDIRMPGIEVDKKLNKKVAADGSGIVDEDAPIIRLSRQERSNPGLISLTSRPGIAESAFSSLMKSFRSGITEKSMAGSSNRPSRSGLASMPKAQLKSSPLTSSPRSNESDLKSPGKSSVRSASISPSIASKSLLKMPRSRLASSSTSTPERSSMGSISPSTISPSSSPSSISPSPKAASPSPRSVIKSPGPLSYNISDVSIPKPRKTRKDEIDALSKRKLSGLTRLWVNPGIVTKKVNPFTTQLYENEKVIVIKKKK